MLAVDITGFGHVRLQHLAADFGKIWGKIWGHLTGFLASRRKKYEV
ncbi:MAG: hypothetical protein NT140_03775 [Deltaproteobacteria bacterium]|nr:hypothetical protein [Deltaproteobacteria bacterium]